MLSGSAPLFTNASTIAGTAPRSAHRSRRRRQRAEEAHAVLTCPQPRVTEDDRPAIGGAPDQAAEPLTQADDRHREDVLPEWVAKLLRARPHEWIRRNGERQLVDDHAAKPVTGDVDALPEAARRQQHGAWIGKEALQDLTPRSVEALGQAGDAPRVETILEQAPDALERPVAREEDEGVAVEPACDAVDELRHLRIVDGVVIRRGVLRQDADRLTQIVERRSQRQLIGGGADADARADELEAAGDRQRRGGEHDRLRRIEDALGKRDGHVDRRLVQLRLLAAHLDPGDRSRTWSHDHVVDRRCQARERRGRVLELVAGSIRLRQQLDLHASGR